MSDLVEKVAEAINSYDPCLVEAEAAIAVVLKEQFGRLQETFPNDKHVAPFLRAYAHENGIELGA